MYQLINDILLNFLPKFKRIRTWKWFAAAVIGFMIRTNTCGGITSIISSLRLKPELYHDLLHFFRSDGYAIEELYDEWIRIAANNSELLYVGGRVLLLGDHIKVSKEGRRMPDIQLLHQESENSGKGEFIAGHNYGHVSAVITNGKVSRSLPLITELQKSPPKDEISKKPVGDTLVVQMIHLTEKVAASLEKPVIVALDSYFSKSSAFKTTEKINTETDRKIVSIVTRGKTNTVAFTIPQVSEAKKGGRPKKYGDKIVLNTLFADEAKFTETSLILYGKKTKIHYLLLDFLWKPAKKLIRFVLVESERGKIILMSDDLSLTPEEIITAYAARYKIETSFGEQKNDMGCFSYHFWTTSLPKRRKWDKNNQKPITESQANIEKAKEATRGFVCLSTIATGIMTLVAFSHSQEIWRRYPGWIRTLRSTIPSIAIVKETLAQDFRVILKSSRFGTFMGFNFIHHLQRESDFLYENLVADAA